MINGFQSLILIRLNIQKKSNINIQGSGTIVNSVLSEPSLRLLPKGLNCLKSTWPRVKGIPFPAQIIVASHEPKSCGKLSAWRCFPAADLLTVAAACFVLSLLWLDAIFRSCRLAVLEGEADLASVLTLFFWAAADCGGLRIKVGKTADADGRRLSPPLGEEVVFVLIGGGGWSGRRGPPPAVAFFVFLLSFSWWSEAGPWVSATGSRLLLVRV